MYPPSPMHPFAHLRMPVDANPNPLDVAFWDVCHGTVPVERLWEFSRDWERSLWDVTGVATRERTQRSIEFDVDNNQLLDATVGTELELLVYTIVRERAFRVHPFIPGLWIPFLTSIISVYTRVCGYRGVTSSFLIYSLPGMWLKFSLTHGLRVHILARNWWILLTVD